MSAKKKCVKKARIFLAVYAPIFFVDVEYLSAELAQQKATYIAGKLRQ